MQGDEKQPNAPLANNFRPPQPLHHRPVRTNIDFNVQVIPSVIHLLLACVYNRANLHAMCLGSEELSDDEQGHILQRYKKQNRSPLDSADLTRVPIIPNYRNIMSSIVNLSKTVRNASCFIKSLSHCFGLLTCGSTDLESPNVPFPSRNALNRLVICLFSQ